MEYCYQCKETEKTTKIYQCDKCPNTTCFEHMWYGACEICWDHMIDQVNPGPFEIT